MRLSAALLLMTASVFAQDVRPKLSLEGTGRVCGGHFHMDEKRVIWKSSFSSCSAGYQVIDHHGLDWTLKLDSGAVCKAFSAIVIHKTDPHQPDSFWNISGYERTSDLGKVPDRAGLSCSMY